MRPLAQLAAILLIAGAALAVLAAPFDPVRWILIAILAVAAWVIAARWGQPGE